MRIICVDDEKLILDLTVSMCRNLPQKPEVIGFQKAEDALDWFHRHNADIALLDINMYDMDGMALAATMKEINRHIAIIFLTGYAEYAVDAFSMHASGYLMKPINEGRLAAEIHYATQMTHFNRTVPGSCRIFVRTFGNFDVIVNGETILFSRSKSKELLAYLVDRRGGFVTRSNAFSALWENQQYDRPMQKQFDVVLRSLRATLEKYGIAEMIEMTRGNIRVVPERFDCDLYRFYNGDIDAVNSYRGEYMSDYSWASITEANISKWE